MSTDGKWMVSDNEENWTYGEEFDSREDAVAHALGEFAEYQGLEPGDRVWVGQVEAITRDELTIAMVGDAWHYLDNLQQYLYEQVGEAAEDVDATKDQELDLERRLREAVRGWLDAYSIDAPCFRFGRVFSVVIGEGT